jgi:type II secretion system protein I
MRRRGFTLVEVLVAMVLFAMALAAVLTLSTALARMNGLYRNLTMATALAEQKVEQLLRQGYTAASSGSDRVGVYTREWVVTPLTAPVRKHVMVTTSWPEPRDMDDHVVLEAALIP